jgi:hypothetical protein
MIVKYASAVIVGSLFFQSLALGCPTHDRVCESLAEPWHTHNEIPTGGNKVIVSNSMAASGSNVSVGISSINLGGFILDGRLAKG